MFFGDQFENWLEHVGGEAQALVDALQEAGLRLGFEAVVADQAADEGPVILLEMDLVVFLAEA